MGNASAGLIGCSNQNTPNEGELQGMTIAKIGDCVPCPSNFYRNCNQFGPEWAMDSNTTEGVGCKLQCKRISYNNRDPSCCWGQQTFGKQTTCDPILNKSNSDCKLPIINYCSTDQNINNSFCKSLNQDFKNNILYKYCSDDPNRINSQTCKDFVLGLPQQGNLDSLMQTYCAQNPNSDLCCYMLSKIPCPNKFDTRCFDKAAYQTSAMVSTVCPNVLNCNQYINLDSNSKLFASNVEANCGNTYYMTDIGKEFDSLVTLFTQYYFVFLFILLLILVIIYFWL